ncbi:hypothetical protein BJEO58_02655 [Brevibacterium jeotgali]|uniref:Uncharacterized protein n=1 Tax=Brevibacterium jeotgali TaxID=1262550 RepID=A0A2H1L832_9MICO|nr:hypothetical protein BJEO58_02655 [Brevibacterium jeotgali]
MGDLQDDDGVVDSQIASAQRREFDVEPFLLLPVGIPTPLVVAARIRPMDRTVAQRCFQSALLLCQSFGAPMWVSGTACTDGKESSTTGRNVGRPTLSRMRRNWIIVS